jgi:spore coat protein U-like protein
MAFSDPSLAGLEEKTEVTCDAGTTVTATLENHSYSLSQKAVRQFALTNSVDLLHPSVLQLFHLLFCIDL